MTPHDNITVLCVAPSLFGRLMPFCADTIERGLVLAGDMGTMGTVIDRIERGDLQVWLVTDGREPLATCFTDIHQDARGRWVAVYGLAGKRIMKWARQLSDQLAAFARDERCTRVLFQGRQGWARLLPEFRQVGRLGDEWLWERRVAS